MNTQDTIIDVTELLHEKDRIIIQLNDKINRLEKLNKEMMNVIKFNTNQIDRLTEDCKLLYMQLKEKSTLEREPESNEPKLPRDMRKGNSNFGKWLYQKKLDKKKIIEIQEDVRESLFINGKNKKKYSSLDICQNDSDNICFENLYILNELFELSKAQKNHREYSSELIHLSFLVYRLSSSAYELLRKFIPFPSHNIIYEHINQFLPSIISSLKDFQVMKIPHKTIQFAMKSKKPVPIVLGIDAVCIVASSKYNNAPTKNLYSFTIYLQPIGIDNKCLPVRIIESQSGIGNKEIVKLFLETSEELARCNFSINYLSFDGDQCYNQMHQNFFNSYEKLLLSGDLMKVIIFLKDKKRLLIGDYLHIMKNQKSRFLKSDISLDQYGSVVFNLKDLINALGTDKVYLKDTSQLGSMRDGLALQLYDMNNILLLIQQKKFNLVMALLPLSLFQFAMRSNDLPIYWRVYSLILCFWLCYNHYLIVKSRDKSNIGLTKRKNKKYCSYFSLIALKRLLNTLISIIIAFYNDYESLCLDRLGTHCLELFFGLIRGFSKGVDGWPTFYRTVGKTIMAQDSLSKLNIKTEIKHRANLAGVVITDHLDIALFPRISFEASETAKSLFRFLLNENDYSYLVSNFFNWVFEMSKYFPSPKKCTNPTSGVKIISRLINASKKGTINPNEIEDDEDDDDDDDDDDE